MVALRFFGIAVAISLSTAVYASTVTVDVKLSPAGSFVGKAGGVTGSATKTADGVAAENVVIDATAFKTGISLRDDHLKKRLQTDKFPQIKLVKAFGKDGKGKAQIDIMGMTKEYDGTYKIEGDTLKAEFPVKLPELNITDVKYMGIGVKDEILVKVELPIEGENQARQ